MLAQFDINVCFQTGEFPDEFTNWLLWENEKLTTKPPNKNNSIYNNDNYEGIVYTLEGVPDEKVYKLYQKTMEIKNVTFNQKRNKTWRIKVFKQIVEQIKLIIRIVTNNDLLNELLYPLFQLLNRFYEFTMEKFTVITNKGKNLTKKQSNLAKENEEILLECSSIIHRCFTLCLNDRNPNMLTNKRKYIIFFINLEFKMYHRLQNFEMIKNLIKVLSSRSILDNIIYTPDFKNSNTNINRFNSIKQQNIIFNYYMGQYFGCQENNFVQASSYLYASLIQCETNYVLQVNKILKLLIPFVLLSHGKIFNFEPWLSEYQIPNYYLALIKSILEGKIIEYDKILITHEKEILQTKTYIAWQLIHDIVNLQYCKKKILTLDPNVTTTIEFGPQKKKLKSSIIKFNEIEEISECDIANLINLGMIKGYISHTHQCIVLSKTNPFPDLYSGKQL